MPRPEAAVAIVRADLPEDSLLLMRRTEREGDSWSGHWSFPGGHCDPEDSDPLHTALRELEEECGVCLTRDDMEAALPHETARRRVGRYLLVAPFVFHIPRQLPTTPDPGEAAEALWVPLSILLDPARHCLLPIPGLPSDLRYPAVALSGGPLWGFTYRLITDWLGLAPRGPEAGLEAADTVLRFLLSHGLALERSWTPVDGQMTAAVSGAIPVDEVLAHFSEPGCHALAINRLKVRPRCVSVAGPEFEEYVISVVP